MTNVQHVNRWWFKDADDTQGAAELEEAMLALKAIPGVLDVRFGPGIGYAAESRDAGGFHYAVIVTFESPESILLHDPHPLHQHAIAVSNRVSERTEHFNFEG